MADVRLYEGDCLQVLPTLEAGSVHCCVTSPPYWGLRDYGTAKWEGGDPECNHEVQRWDGPKQTQGAQSGHAAKADRLGRDRCHKCGATRIDIQIGLERSPDEYVDKLVQVFREVQRVLRDDGTLWLNLGDSYFGDSPARKKSSEAFSETWDLSQTRSRGGSRRSAARIGDLKPKDLVGIPWMVAFALRADGWYLRSDIIWHKPNPMPESVRDRPTKSHEYLFLLAKSDRYFYDSDAIREPHSNASIERMRQPLSTERHHTPKERRTGCNMNRYLERETGWGNPAGRNRRSVWTIPTRPYAGAHFAVFPPALVEPCIKAGCPVGGTVLDPFAGSGTVGAVALELGRSFVGIELNPKYIDLIRERINGVQVGMPL